MKLEEARITSREGLEMMLEVPRSCNFEPCKILPEMNALNTKANAAFSLASAPFLFPSVHAQVTKFMIILCLYQEAEEFGVQ